MRKLLPAVLVLALGGAVVGAGGVAYWRAFLRGDVAPAPGAEALTIEGDDGASIPPATPAEQGLDAASIDGARDAARALGARAFAIARRGHAVLVWSAVGEELVRSTLLSRLVVAASAAEGDELLTWTLGQRGEGSVRNPWSARSRLRYGPARAQPAVDAAAWARRISLDVWKPLHASSARVELDAHGTPRLQCCIWLRVRDALALATAMVGGGQVDGERLLTVEAATRALQAMDDHIEPRGAEPFGSRRSQLWRDDEGTRLYSFPAEELVILLVRADEARLTDETAIALQVLRGIVDRAPASDAIATPRGLVPAH